MDLRPELLPPLVDVHRLGELCREIKRIAGLINCGEAASEAIAAFNRDTGHRYQWSDFVELEAGRSIEDFATEAARPHLPKVASISRAEIIEIVRRVMAADIDTDYYLRLLETNLSHPAISDLIFHPPTELRDAPAEQIVDVALSHHPIAQ